MTNLKTTKGDTQNYALTFTDDDGVAIDITGYTVFMTVKTGYDVTDEDATISKTVTSHTDPTAGKTTITFTNLDTTVDPFNYRYDIQTKDTSGTITTVMSGTYKVTNEVTRRTS